MVAHGSQRLLLVGIEASPDKMLQGRLFSYHDTHLHRLGANYLQIPINCPYATRVKNYQRDGPMCFDDNQGWCCVRCRCAHYDQARAHVCFEPRDCDVICQLSAIDGVLGGAPNYYPNSFSGPQDSKDFLEYREKCPAGDITRCQ